MIVIMKMRYRPVVRTGINEYLKYVSKLLNNKREVRSSLSSNIEPSIRF